MQPTRPSCAPTESHSSIWATASTTTATARERFIFVFNETSTTEIYTLSLHDALPIYVKGSTRFEDAAFHLAEAVETLAVEDGHQFCARQQLARHRLLDDVPVLDQDGRFAFEELVEAAMAEK